jgi:hypothetical protein
LTTVTDPDLAHLMEAWDAMPREVSQKTIDLAHKPQS